jgi:Leucine Rich repeat
MLDVFFKFENSVNIFVMLRSSSCISRSATPSLPIFLRLEIQQIPFICVWLDVQNFGVLDMSVSSYSARDQWLTMLRSISWKAIDAWQHSHSSLIWVILRSISITQILVNLKHRDEERVSDVTFEAVGINRGQKSCGEGQSGDSMLSIWEEGKYLKSVDLSHCHGITDMVVSALADGCGQLQSINLSQCHHITDDGLSALGLGCGQLQSIDLSHCDRVTDDGVSALCRGCGQLQTINISNCCCRQSISVTVTASQVMVYQHWVMDVVSCYPSISVVVTASQT